MLKKNVRTQTVNKTLLTHHSIKGKKLNLIYYVLTKHGYKGQSVVSSILKTYVKHLHKHLSKRMGTRMKNS